MDAASDNITRFYPQVARLAPQADDRNLPALAPVPGQRYEIALFTAVIVLYVLVGLIGHDPWKQDETYITAIVRHMLDSGDWTVPMMAGEPFMEKPPLFYWVAALCAGLFSPFLPLHDGARLATGFFVSGTCVSVAWIGRRWWGRRQGRICLVMLLSCLGMVLHAHIMLTDLAMLMGFAIAMCGLALCLDKRLEGGILLGTGIGIGFLAKGLLAPCVLWACALLLPLLFDRWRQPDYARTLAISFVAAAPWLFIWPAALFYRSPQLFMEWFWLNNIGRFVGFSVPLLGAIHSKWFWLTTLPWFAFPALPLALLSLWHHRTTAFFWEPFQISIVVTVALMAVLWQSASARDNYALPLLLPLALLGAPAAARLPAAVDRFWRWVACALGVIFAAFTWGTWVCMMLKGAPPTLPIIANYLPHQFIPRFEAPAFLAALAMTVAPLFLARHLLRLAGPGLSAWFASLTIGWGLVACLWLPWLDTAKSYRGVYDSVKTALPTRYKCVAEIGMGESERAMLAYYLGVTAARMQSARGANCDVLLINGAANDPPRDTDLPQWTQVWQGARPGDRGERFWLYTHVAIPGK
jgi:4-amino-4-deoxy-L-arabinose transferase-like glycosyltransferase